MAKKINTDYFDNTKFFYDVRSAVRTFFGESDEIDSFLKTYADIDDPETIRYMLAIIRGFRLNAKFLAYLKAYFAAKKMNFSKPDLERMLSIAEDMSADLGEIYSQAETLQGEDVNHMYHEIRSKAYFTVLFDDSSAPDDIAEEAFAEE